MNRLNLKEAIYNTMITLLELFGLDEIGHDEMDYTGEVHPHLEKMRKDIDQTAQWIARGLQRIEDPEADHLIKTLRNLSKLPSEQIMPTIMRMQTVIHKISQEKKKDDNKAVTDALKDVQQGFPALMKFGSQVGKSTHSDKGLYQTRMKGRWDDEEGFIPLSQVTEPTGGDPEDFIKKRTDFKPKPGSPAAAKAAASKPKPMQSISPIIRKKPVVPGPVKPKKVGENYIPTMFELFYKKS